MIILTKVEDIFSRFLQKISEYKFLVDIGNPEAVATLEGTLNDYLTSARAKFYQCPKSLNLDAEKKNIISDLDDLEIDILSLLMLIEYFYQIMIRNETVEQAVGDSDFNIYSQANHINQLKDLHKELRNFTAREISRYTYRDRIYAKKTK